MPGEISRPRTSTELGGDPRSLPGGWLRQLLPFLILLASALYLDARWDEIPDPWISHWNGDFVADGWSPKTPLHVYGILLLGLGNLLFVFAVQWGLLRWKSLSDDPEERRRQAAQLRLTALVCLAVEYLMAPIYAVAGLAPLAQSPGQARWLVATILVGTVVGSLLLLAWIILYLGREWKKLRAEMDEEEAEHWTAGIFYHDRDDPRLVVPKRLGVGYTFNFGRPAAWISLFLLLAVPLALIAYLFAR